VTQLPQSDTAPIAPISLTQQKLKKVEVELGMFFPCQDFAAQIRIWEKQNWHKKL
jgi:hypothetical protein